MNTFSLNIPISKVDEEQRIVYGYATGEELDRQGDIVDYEASKKAFSKWAGNIREQHDSKRAVGKNVHLEFDDAGKKVLIGAKISRSADGQNAWTKVQEGILTGFSIGGKVYKTILDTVKGADGDMTANRITDYDLAEVSLVDVPACPSAQFVMVKSADGIVKEVEEMHTTDQTPWFYKYYGLNQTTESGNNNSMSKAKEQTMSKDANENPSPQGSTPQEGSPAPSSTPPAPSPNAPAGGAQASQGGGASQSPQGVSPAPQASGEIKKEGLAVHAGEPRDAEAQPTAPTIAGMNDSEAADHLKDQRDPATAALSTNTPEAEAEGKKQTENIDNSPPPPPKSKKTVEGDTTKSLFTVEELHQALNSLNKTAEPEVPTASEPHDLQKMVEQKFEATKDDLLKSFTAAVHDKVAEIVSPLEDRIKAIEGQPAAGAPKRYAVVDKVADAPETPDSEYEKLLVKAADMEANPSAYSAMDRANLASSMMKAKSAQRPIPQIN